MRKILLPDRDVKCMHGQMDIDVEDFLSFLLTQIIIYLIILTALSPLIVNVYINNV